MLDAVDDLRGGEQVFDQRQFNSETNRLNARVQVSLNDIPGGVPVVRFAVADDKQDLPFLLPEEKRVKRLGDVVRPEQILSRPGDVDRGRKLFFDASGVQCRNCHRIEGKGVEVGPDLDQIGKKYDRGQILDQILNPSKQMETKYLTYLVATKQGRVHTGLLVSRDGTRVVLKPDAYLKSDGTPPKVTAVLDDGHQVSVDVPRFEVRTDCAPERTLVLHDRMVPNLEDTRELWAQVVEAEQMEHGCVQVVRVDLRANRLESDLVRRAERRAGLHTTAREPLRVAPWVVVAAVAALAVRRAAELRRPDDERRVEQAELREIREQARDRLVDDLCVRRVVDVEPLVRERFRSAALGGNRSNPYGTADPHRLARSVIQPRDGMRFFIHKAQGGMALEERARRRLDRWRYARRAG